MREVARHLYDAQVAHLFKVPEEWTQTPCDFFGHTAHGRAIMMECKQVNRTSLPIHDAPGLAPHQWLHLRQGAACGVHAFIIWRRRQETAVLKIPAAVLLSEGRASIPWKGGADGFLVEDLLRFFTSAFWQM